MLKTEIDTMPIDVPGELAEYMEMRVAFSRDFAGEISRADLISCIRDDTALIDKRMDGEHIERKIGLGMEHIAWRISALGNDVYPFVREGSRIVCVPSLSDRQTIYLYLLVCANKFLLTEEKSLSNFLGTGFEGMCKHALKGLFPDWADVFAFATGTKDREEIFGRDARDALRELSNRLNTSANESMIESIESTSDFGMDLVAIAGFEDQAEHPFYATAQCTVQKQWWRKSREGRLNGSLIKVTFPPPSPILFIPHMPRTTNGKWEEPYKMTDCLLCDRLRICRLFEKAGVFTDQAELPKEIHRAVSFIRKCMLDDE